MSQAGQEQISEVRVSAFLCLSGCLVYLHPSAAVMKEDHLMPGVASTIGDSRGYTRGRGGGRGK